MQQVILLLGSNLGDREAYLKQAREAIGRYVGPVVKASKVYRSEPWGAFAESVSGEQFFLNQALIVETEQSPEPLLDTLQQIECDLGRTQKTAPLPSAGGAITQAPLYHARSIDIDILFYGDEIIDNERLKVPHPLLPRRLFALEPLVEIAPDFCHPSLKISIKEIFNRLRLGYFK